jgi:DNA polymerase III delta prime subunit
MNKKNFVSEFHDASEAIEEAYEFMLAYAAQGRIDEDESSAPSIRQLLENAKKSLLKLANKMGLKDEDIRKLYGIDFENFVKILSNDATKSQNAVKLVLSSQTITSQLIDNLNASIHLRALLTDMFLVDEYINNVK